MAAQKVALVTGAGAGIGKASALALAKAGYAVVGAGRRLQPLEETAAVVKAAGGHMDAIACDVSDAAAVDALFAEINRLHGRLDVVFNNAGISAKGATIDEIPPSEWLNVIGANLNGSFFVARGAFAMMRRQTPQGGRIINNGSISAYAPRPGSAPYTASKHAITGLTKTIALDGRPFDIACGQIDIGNAATEMTEKMAQGVPQANGTMAVEARMDVQHVADAVVHMASLPLGANILFMTVMATKMPFVGRG